MHISKEVIRKCKKSCIIDTLFCDMWENKSYARIQSLYEIGNVKPDMLLKKLHSNRAGTGNFIEMIYCDIVFVLADEIMDKEELRIEFEKLYKKLYPIANNAYEKIIADVKYSDEMKELPHASVPFFKYLIYSSGIIQKTDHAIAYIDIEWEAERADSYEEPSYFRQEAIFNEACFADEDEKIFTSDLYKTYIIRRRKELANFLGVEEKELDEKIHDDMKSRIFEFGDCGLSIQDSDEYIPIGMARAILSIHGGDGIWYESITSTKKNMQNFKSYSHVPNVAFLIEEYYKAFILKKLIECEAKNEKFTKRVLSRECRFLSEELKNDRTKVDLQGIYFAYAMDVLCKMISIEMEERYKNFSWEQLTGKTLEKRFEAAKDEMKKTIMEQQNMIKTLSEQKISLELRCMKKSDAAIIGYVQENQRLIKESEEQRDKINRLREQLESQNEFLEALRTEEPEETVKNIDVELLKSKKYLFVGDIDDALPDLKKDFPNSIFMKTETMSISGITVDAIVFLIRYMSHSMFYKVKNSKSYQEVPAILCNIKNKELLYSKIQKELFD